MGRPLVQSDDPSLRECVHHKDEDRTNNDSSNLEVLTFSAHRSHHTRTRNEREFEPRRPSAEAVAEALRLHPTILAAAESLGMCHQTLRKHFPELLTPYKRRSPTKPHEPSSEQLAAIRAAAADPMVGEREAGRLVGLSPKTLRKVCDAFGIQWVRKSKAGMMKRTHGGKPTPRWLEACGKLTAPD